MPFGMVGRTGPGMRQVAGFWDLSTGRGNFGANMGRPIETKGDFAAAGLLRPACSAAGLVINRFPEMHTCRPGGVDGGMPRCGRGNAATCNTAVFHLLLLILYFYKV